MIELTSLADSTSSFTFPHFSTFCHTSRPFCPESLGTGSRPSSNTHKQCKVFRLAPEVLPKGDADGTKHFYTCVDLHTKMTLAKFCLVGGMNKYRFSTFFVCICAWGAVKRGISTDWNFFRLLPSVRGWVSE